MERKYAGNKNIKEKERKERRNVRGNKVEICGRNDTKYSKFTSKSEIHSKYLKTSVSSSQKYISITKTNRGKINSFVENHILCEKKMTELYYLRFL